jgi:hypothetical protein
MLDIFLGVAMDSPPADLGKAGFRLVLTAFLTAFLAGFWWISGEFLVEKDCIYSLMIDRDTDVGRPAVKEKGTARCPTKTSETASGAGSDAAGSSG